MSNENAMNEWIRSLKPEELAMLLKILRDSIDKAMADKAMAELVIG